MYMPKKKTVSSAQHLNLIVQTRQLTWTQFIPFILKIWNKGHWPLKLPRGSEQKGGGWWDGSAGNCACHQVRWPTWRKERKAVHMEVRGRCHSDADTHHTSHTSIPHLLHLPPIHPLNQTKLFKTMNWS